MYCVHLAVLGAVGGGLASSAQEWLLQRLGAVIAQRGIASVALPPKAQLGFCSACALRGARARSAAASPSLASGVSRHPSQASSRVGQRSCRRESDGKTSGTASTDVTSSSPNSGLSLKLRLFRMDPKQLIFKKLLRGCEKKSAGYGIQVCLCSQSSSRPRHGAAVRYGLQCNCVQHAHQADHGLLISNAIVAVWSSGPAFILAEG